MSLVPRQALIARPTGAGSTAAIWQYLADLFRSLFQSLAAHADAINSLSDRGISRPVPLTSYTVATVPAASAHSGAIIYVSDEAGGAQPAFSDGTDWRRLSDRTVIS